MGTARLFGSMAAGSGVPFSLKADGVNLGAASLGMAVAGGARRASLGAPMIAWNDRSGTMASVPMWASGEGELANHRPATASLAMHVMRWPRATVPFSLAGRGEALDGSFPASSLGSAMASGDVTMTTTGIGAASRGLSLRTRGL